MATPEQDSPIKKRRGPSVLGWIMMGMLIVGLGGFGVTNFGGSTAAIGRVGDRDIEVDTYVRELRQELSAFSAQVGQQIGLPQAQALGLDQKVLQTVIARTALDAEAEEAVEEPRVAGPDASGYPRRSDGCDASDHSEDGVLAVHRVNDTTDGGGPQRGQRVGAHREVLHEVRDFEQGRGSGHDTSAR